MREDEETEWGSDEDPNYEENQIEDEDDYED
jgi:hypothetical protein